MTRWFRMMVLPLFGGSSVAQDWSDPKTAISWDTTGNTRNPIRVEQLDMLATIIKSRYSKDDWILDLGYGSGQVEQFLFEQIPGAQILGIDNSAAMMRLASERLTPFASQFMPVEHDLRSITSLVLPNHSYSFVIAVQSLHHLSNEQMYSVYEYIHGVLARGGMFLLLDKLKVETEHLWQVMNAIWKRQDELYGSVTASHEGESFAGHEQSVLNRGDYPVPLDQHLKWLRAIGFEANCVHLYGHRGLIVGYKAE